LSLYLNPLAKILNNGEQLLTPTGPYIPKTYKMPDPLHTSQRQAEMPVIAGWQGINSAL
jgi:hypothetical protein